MVFSLGQIIRVSLWLTILIIHTRFFSLHDVAMARQVTKLTNQQARFDVNPKPVYSYLYF